MPGAYGKPTMPDWLVGAKVQPPRTGSNELVRLSAHGDILDRFITYIEAPAGFGKTTLLNQYRQHWLGRDGAGALWLTLSRDDTSRSLVEYLAFAMIRQQVAVNEDFFDGLAETATLTKHLNILANALEFEDTDWLIVLDDLEAVGAEVCETIEYLIGVAPPNVRLLIAGRRNPGLALSRYAAQEQLHHVRPDELSFSPQHIMALFGDGLSLEGATRIQEATLGWPIAVRLVTMDMKAGCSIEDALRRLGDATATASHYIKEQIESRLSPALRTMLLHASVLDWLERDALVATQGNDNLLTHLGDLGEVGSLISPIGEETDTYRIHPLLREFLRDSLRREDPEKLRQLHRAAAIWMGHQNRLRLALSHAYQSDDQMLIGTLIEEFGAVRLFIREGVSRAFSSQVYLNEQILVAFPRVALMYCVIQTKLGYLSDARATYVKIAKLTDGFTRDRPGGDDAAIALEHLFSLPLMVLYGALPNKYLTQTELDRMPESMGASALVDGAYNNTLCISNFVKGNLGEASRRVTYAKRFYEEASSFYGLLYMDLHEAAIAFNRGELETANALYDTAKALQRRLFREDEGARLACDLLQSELRLVRGDFDSLEKFIPTLAKRLIAFEAWRDLHGIAASVAVDYHLARNSPEDALGILAELYRYLHKEQITDLLPMLERKELALRAAMGDMPSDDISSILPAPGAILATLAETPWRDVESATWAHYQLQQLGHAQALGDLVDRVAADFLEKGLRIPAGRVLVTAAASEWTVGHSETATRLLGEAAHILRPCGGMGPFRVHADTVREIARADGALDQETRLWLLDIVTDANAEAEKPIFSPRERDVLAHLLDGKQDKVIARELGVTEHAVRYHLKNIYARMQVSGRHEAIAHIRKKNLLPQ